MIICEEAERAGYRQMAQNHLRGVGDGDGNAVGVSCPAVPGLQCAWEPKYTDEDVDRQF